MTREALRGMQATDGPLLVMRDVAKEYEGGAGTVSAVRGLDLEVFKGEFLAIVGRSGGGKSTLLNMAAGIDSPSSGSITIGEARLHEMSQNELAVWRGENVGVVFQFFQLLPTLTAAENVMLPMDLRKTVPPSGRRTRALELLTRVGMDGFADRLPHELSGGQQQRVAIARALANDPSLILADEPTGNLDSATSSAMLDLFVELQAEGVTVVVVSHEREISRWASRTVEIRDGKLIADQSEILPDLVASEVLS